MVLALLAGAAWLLPSLAARHARPAVLNLGPNDVDYVEGFREDWERDVLTRFRWTQLRSTIRLPLTMSGPDHRLRWRFRRHFIEPARVKLTIEGRTVATFQAAADAKTPYQTLEFPLPPLQGRDPFSLDIESSSASARPLGIALDWMEIVRVGPQAAFGLLPATSLRLVVVVLAAFLAPRLAGLSRAQAAAHAVPVAVALVAGVFWDIVACERILREGTAVYLAVAVAVVFFSAWSRARSFLGIASTRVAGALATVVLVALALRLAMLLHPQFYYPDVKVHALFAWQLARQGLPQFLRDFTVNQYRYSLGLQFEHGHWYAFPYPPVFYVLTWPLVRLAHFRPEVAVSVLGATVNSLTAFLVFGIARRLRRTSAEALGAAALVIVLPIYIARLALAYFPALVGHAVDMAVVLYVLARFPDLPRPRIILTMAGLLAAALLTYTQALLNFGILLPLFLVLLVAADRSPATRKRAVTFVFAGAFGALLSLLLFYGRYIPVFLDMQHGRPQAQEQVLLEKWARAPVPAEKPAPDKDDIFAGPDVNPWRGLRKAGWRLYVFYGLFAPAIVVGVVLLARRLERPEAPFVTAWALTYLVLNLASGGLPGPNLVRYNKDLEIVAPLASMSVSVLTQWLWERSRPLAILFAGSFTLFGLWRAVGYLTEKFVFER